MHVVPVGSYNDLPIYVRNGKFGPYMAWNNLTFSIPKTWPTVDLISAEMAIELILAKHTTKVPKKRIFGPRRLTASLKLCKRRDGVPYVVYIASDTTEVSRLGFIGFTNGNPLNCTDEIVIEWLKDKYGVS